MSAALKTMFMSLTERGMAIPPNVGDVRAVVLRAGTPRRIAALAAGFHQSLQQRAAPVKTVHIMKLFAKACSEALDVTGTAVLSDEQVYSVLFSHGIMPKVPKNEALAMRNVDLSNADEVNKKEVCKTWCELCFFASFLFSTEGELDQRLAQSASFCGSKSQQD